MHEVTSSFVLTTVSVQEVHKHLEKNDIPTAHPSGFDLSTCWNYFVVSVAYVTNDQGQKRLQADLKQPDAKSQPKRAKSAPKEKPQFVVKRHKRKGQSGEIITAAIHCNSTGKQVAQLSSNANSDCENLVGKMVLQLNEGKQSLQSVIQELNDLKGS